MNSNVSFRTLSLLLIIVFASTVDPLDLPQGSIEPLIERTRSGKTFYSYRKVPFAKPPIGRYRFRESELSEDPWVGPRDSKEDVPNCLQEHGGSIVGQEDCLYLNLYKPEIEDNQLLPVMVFLHGGAFVSGSATESVFHPTQFVEEDVILVVPNYRLGIFGFLHSSNESADIPGNVGLKDQVLALKWVQKNVEHFGGDPNSVTVFGICGGSVSTHLHLISPLSKGLFHRAIAESGTAFNPWGLGERNTARRIADLLHISTDDAQRMADQLRTTDANKLMDAQMELITPTALYNELPSGPVTENRAVDGRTFLTGADLERTDPTDVPLIIGYTNAEAIIVDVLNRAIHNRTVPIELDKFVPKGTDWSADRKREFVRKLRAFYFKGDRSDTESYVELMSDAWFMTGIRQAAYLQLSRTHNSSIYFYRFAMETRLNYVKNMDAATAKYAGASHGDEIGYLFARPDRDLDATETANVRRLIKLWTTFAKTGDPNCKMADCEHCAIGDTVWEPLRPDRFNYLHLGNDLATGFDPDQERYEFWMTVTRDD